MQKPEKFVSLLLRTFDEAKSSQTKSFAPEVDIQVDFAYLQNNSLVIKDASLLELSEMSFHIISDISDDVFILSLMDAATFLFTGLDALTEMCSKG